MSDHEDMRAHIISRLERLQTLDKLAEEISSPRRGNGWDPSKIAEAVVRVVPQSLDKLARKAVRPGISSGIVDFFRPAYAASRLAGPPTLVYFPLWHVKGYYECFYLRDTGYKIRVDKDVVAVEIDGETRDLMIEEPEGKIGPDTLGLRLKRLSRLLTGEKRYFNLSNAIELAMRHKRTEMYVTSDGREGSTLEEVLPNSWRTQRMFEVGHLKVEGAATKIAASKETKERVVQRFQERVVRIPETSRQILSNTFVIDELTQYYVPYVHFPVMRGTRIDHVVLYAASAEVPDERECKLVRNQLGL